VFAPVLSNVLVTALLVIALKIWVKLADGFFSSIKATTPLTWGQAIEVPEMEL